MTQRTTFEPRADETMESYLVIHQTYSSIRVNGLYAISDSQSLSADFAIGKSRCMLSYIFRTDAHTMYRTGNPPSRGAAVLKVGRKPQLHLEGRLLDGARNTREREVGGAHIEDLRHLRGSTSSDVQAAPPAG